MLVRRIQLCWVRCKQFLEMGHGRDWWVPTVCLVAVDPIGPINWFLLKPVKSTVDRCLARIELLRDTPHRKPRI